METAGGGWTIIQRRKSGLVSFHRDWKQYRQGFGSIRGDFWLGNEHIHRLSRRPTRLRVEMEVSASLGPARVTVHDSGGAIPSITHFRITYYEFSFGLQ